VSEVCNHSKFEQDSVKVIRKATEDDQKKFSWLQRKERRAFEFCLERIKERNLLMKFEDESRSRMYDEEEKVEED